MNEEKVKNIMSKFNGKEMEEIAITIKNRLEKVYPVAFKNCKYLISHKIILFKFTKGGEYEIRVPSVFTANNKSTFWIALVKIEVPAKFERNGICTELMRTLEEIAFNHPDLSGVVLESIGTEKMLSLALKLGYQKDQRMADENDGFFLNYFKLFESEH